jgi:hypothetical protein
MNHRHRPKSRRLVLQLLFSRPVRLLKSWALASLTLAFRCKRISSCLLAKSRRGGIGRRAGLKIQYWQQCVGSIPSVGRGHSGQRRTSAHLEAFYFRFLPFRSHVLWTCCVGRAGARPDLATREATPWHIYFFSTS